MLVLLNKLKWWFRALGPWGQNPPRPHSLKARPSRAPATTHRPWAASAAAR